MKKFISGLLTGAIIASTVAFAASYVAEPASFKVIVNGNEFTSDPPALVVEGRTYLPLRAMGDALGVPVEWNNELGQAEVGNCSVQKTDAQTLSVADKGDYSRNNPAPLNTIQKITKTSDWLDSGNYTVSVRIIETIRGEKAWEMIKSANMFNNEAPDGKEYLLAKIAVSCISTKGDMAYEVSDYYFDAFSANNEEYDKVFVVKPEPNLSGKLYPGGNTEGWVAFLVNKDDKAPKCAFGLDYDGQNGIWFALQ